MNDNSETTKLCVICNEPTGLGSDSNFCVNCRNEVELMQRTYPVPNEVSHHRALLFLLKIEHEMLMTRETLNNVPNLADHSLQSLLSGGLSLLEAQLKEMNINSISHGLNLALNDALDRYKKMISLFIV